MLPAVTGAVKNPAALKSVAWIGQGKGSAEKAPRQQSESWKDKGFASSVLSSRPAAGQHWGKEKQSVQFYRLWVRLCFVKILKRQSMSALLHISPIISQLLSASVFSRCRSCRGMCHRCWLRDSVRQLIDWSEGWHGGKQVCVWKMSKTDGPSGAHVMDHRTGQDSMRKDCLLNFVVWL